MGPRFGRGDGSRGWYRGGCSKSAPARELAAFPSCRWCQYQITLHGEPIDVRRRSVRHPCYMKYAHQAGFWTERLWPLTHYRTLFERAGRRKSRFVRRARRSPAHQYPPFLGVGNRYRTTWTNPSFLGADPTANYGRGSGKGGWRCAEGGQALRRRAPTYDPFAGPTIPTGNVQPASN